MAERAAVANEPVAFAAILAGGWLLDRGASDLKTAFSSSSTGTGTGGTGTTTGTGKGGVTSPFPHGWVPNRLDAGYDGTFSGALVAPFSGTITYAADSFSNWGGWLEIKADSPIPGLPTDTLYFAEGLSPTVKAGQHVSAGQQIATPAPSPYGDAYGTTSDGSGQIEWGLASPGTVGSPSNPLAYSSSSPVQLVLNFAHWAVNTLGLAAPTQTSHAGYA